MEWSINDVARTAGVTSRTLRHYHDIGLLTPSRVGHNGYRYYDQDALLRLQRILLLRELGLGLPEITTLMEGQLDATSALGTHLRLLESERDRISRQIQSVKTTLDKLAKDEQLMVKEMLDGFDHTQYKDEVIQRWGNKAYTNGDNWWKSLSDREKKEFQQRQRSIATDFAEAHERGEAPDGPRAQQVTRRHYEWVTTGWGGNCPTAEQFTGLGQMYVDDPRFSATYGDYHAGTAAFIRDAMKIYAERNLR